MKTLTIGDLKARIPIIQGGMGVGISLSGLASAVANEGGIGVISAAGLGLLYKKLSPSNLYGSWESRVSGRDPQGPGKSERYHRRKRNGGSFRLRRIGENQYSGKGRHHFSGAGLPLDLPSFPQER